MTSYCIAPTLLSNARSSTKKHSRLSVRPATRSSVPNPQITVIAKRSSQAEHAGQRIEVYTNQVFSTIK